ncbi:hypothetical protein LX83_006067 [Goodfellowiella coeruleoviolacea]|uniref:Uncharacterized protein n=1 Tax=Goodfellowiella coeruleoviolacea TaxID=334858 RepID=A0AAE3GND1_9PSEU|nr:hypothetical protein [Goodfellowiella coeruleoviolacea]
MLVGPGGAGCCRCNARSPGPVPAHAAATTRTNANTRATRSSRSLGTAATPEPVTLTWVHRQAPMSGTSPRSAASVRHRPHNGRIGNGVIRLASTV